MFGNPYVVFGVLAIAGICLGVYHYLNRNPVDWSKRETTQHIENQRWLKDLMKYRNQ